MKKDLDQIKQKFGRWIEGGDISDKVASHFKQIAEMEDGPFGGQVVYQE